MDIWQVAIPGYEHSRAFDTVALCLRESLMNLGFESKITTDLSPTNNHIILGAHLLQMQSPKHQIIYNLEQITSYSPLVNANYISLLKQNRVWDYSKRNIAELNKLGIEATYMPIGYHPSLTKQKLSVEQDIDCLFYGSVNKRRGDILESARATSLYNMYGYNLDTYIARSRIILNCHYYETKLFEIVRCSYLMANSKFILSEPGLDPDLEQPFQRGIAFHEKEEWPDAIDFYLKNPDIRAKIADKGFEIFSQMKQTEYLKNESKSW